jgi:hypothetical protein
MTSSPSASSEKSTTAAAAATTPIPLPIETTTTTLATEPTDPSFWPPQNPQKEFDWDTPTNVAYQIPNTALFTNTFEDARRKLDYTYHKNPTLPRQAYQDKVLARILEAETSSSSSSSSLPSSSSTTSVMSDQQDYNVHVEEHQLTSQQPDKQQRRPFIVFSAGPMGVGKSFVLSQLHQRHLFPLSRFIKIDPDMLKSELPEIAGYLQYGPETAATKLHRESTQMADVLFEHALASNKNILVDGSLRDVAWYRILFQRLRTDFPQYVLCILYVSASSDTIKDRAHQRAISSGRVVPNDMIQSSIDQVPQSVAALTHMTDYTFEISNDDNAPMTLKLWMAPPPPPTIASHCLDGETISDDRSMTLSTKEMLWEDFRQVWETDHVKYSHITPAQQQQQQQQQKGVVGSEDVGDTSSIYLQPQRQHVKEEHEEDSTIPITIYSHMAQAYQCPTRQQTEIQSAKKIWGKAYPNFCPRCTIWADEQCKYIHPSLTTTTPKTTYLKGLDDV